MSRSHRHHTRRDVEDDDNVDGQLTMVRRTPQTLLSSRQQRLGGNGGGDALAPVQYTKVDPQTHAKHYYHNDGNGTQAYAYYYNSDQDPSFNSRSSDNNNTSSHVQTRMCCYTSTSSSSNNGSANDIAAATHRRHIAGEPIVEEPDDDNNNSSSRALALPREFGDPFAAMPKDVMAMHRQMVSSMASPLGLLGDDLFADPFAVHSRLLQQHRGSGDPFGSFSF